MVKAPNPYQIQSRRKPISVLFPYAVLLGRRGQRRMLDAFSRVAAAADSGAFMWHHVKPSVVTLFGMPNPPSLNWVLGLTSPRVLWHNRLHDNCVIAWQAAAPSYTAVNRGVVDELLQAAIIAGTRPKFQSNFHKGVEGDAVRRVRGLGDIGVLKSYLLLVWSELIQIDDRSGGLAEMQKSIREGFCGLWVGPQREDLMKRLDHVLERLGASHAKEDGILTLIRANPGPDPSVIQYVQHQVDDIRMVMERYGELKRVLLEVDREAVAILTRTPPRLIPFSLLTPADAYRIPLNLRVRSASSVTIISHPKGLPLPPITNHFVCTLTPVSIVVTAIPRTLPVSFVHTQLKLLFSPLFPDNLVQRRVVIVGCRQTL